MRNETLYLQRMMECHKHPAGVLALTSETGGTGKINIAVKLSDSESVQHGWRRLFFNSLTGFPKVIGQKVDKKP
jgi:hypothetical protein